MTCSERYEWISVFLKQVMNANEEGNRMEGVVLRDFLKSVVNNPSIHSVYTINLQNDLIANGLFEMTSYYYFQLGEVVDENGSISQYELIIAENSEKNGNMKRMAVLTAESVGSELVEMDSSGVRENVIIDLWSNLICLWVHLT